MKKIFESLTVLVLIFVGFCFLQTLISVNAAPSGYFCLNEEKYGVETLDGVAFIETDSNYLNIIGKSGLDSTANSMKDLTKGEKRYYDHKNEYNEIVLNFTNVYYIGQYTFYNFDHLKTITFNKNQDNENYLNEIGEHAFEGCTLLDTVTFEGKATLTKIDAYAFAGCSNLTTITIPSSVTYIGEHAFDGCTNLTTVIFEGESSLETIGNYAFKDCAKLTDFTIPRSVNSVGAQTFDENATLNAEYKLDYRSMVINSSLNYRLYSSNAPADSYVIFKIADYEFKAVAESGGTYACCYQLTALAPQLLTETITATLYVYGGIVERINFKVIDYLVEMLANHNYHDVAIDLIEYGAASQMYTNYKTNDLATSYVSDYSTADKGFEYVAGKTFIQCYLGGLGKSTSVNLSFTSSGLLFGSQNKLYAKITSNASDFKVLINDIPCEIKNLGNNKYQVFTEGIDPTKYSDEYVFKLLDSNGDVVQKFSYSVDTYLANKIAKSSTDDMKLLAKKTYEFSMSCRNFMSEVTTNE